jgi:WD40 repeat protein
MLKTMLLTKLKTVMALLLLSMVTLTTTLLAWGQTHNKGNSVEKAAGKGKSDPDREKEKERVDRHGDPLPLDAFVRLGTSRFHGDNGHLSIAVSKDEKVLAAAGYDPAIRLLDASTGRLIRELHGHKSAVWAVAFSSDGKKLASGGNDKTVKLWDVDSGKALFSFDVNQPATSVAFSPEGTQVAASCKNGIVRLWDAHSGRQEREITAHLKNDSGKVALAFSPNGKHLATGSADKVIRLWQSATGKEAGRFEGHQSAIATLVFSPDGKTLLSGSSHNSGLDIRSSSGEPTEFPDKNGSLRIWDVATRKALHTLPGPLRGFHSISVAPDGKTAVGMGVHNSIHSFDVTSGRELWQRPGAHLAWVNSACFAAGGQKLVTCGGDGAIRSWDAATGKETRTYTGHSGSVSSLAFAPDGKTVATGGWDHRIQLWNTASGKEQVAFEGHTGAVESVDFSPDGSLLASASEDGTVRLWDLVAGKQRWRFAGHGTSAKVVRFSTDGKTLVSGGGDKRIRIWDVASGRELLSHPLTAQTQISNMAITPGGARLALVNAEGMPADTAVVRIFETGTGKEVRKFAAKEQQSSLAFSLDGETLATGGYNGTIGVWKVLSGEPRLMLKHEASVQALAFSPDGRMLASAGEDSLVRLWELATGQERHRFVGSPKCYSLVFAPDGRRLASGHFNTTTLIWDTPLSHRLSSDQPILSAKRLEALWQDLRGDDAAKAYQAIGELASSPKQAVPFIRKHVWTKSALDVQKIDRLIKELGSDKFATRENASRQLGAFGAVAGGQLREALNAGPNLEIRRRLEILLERLDAESPTGESLRTLRAIETLELSGTSEACELLEMLAKSAPEVRLAAQAQMSLARLKRPSVP